MPGRRNASRKAAPAPAAKRPDPTMKPGQKGANKLYTKAQFTQFYGAEVAKKMWIKAGKKLASAPQSRGPAKPAAGAEKRPDPTMKPGQKGAGKTYTKAQFVSFYGAELAKKMWLKGGKLLGQKKPAAPPRSRGVGAPRAPARKKAPPAPAVAKRPDPTMKPGQKGAGKLYTKAQFTQFYGAEVAKKMWAKAGKLLAKKAPPAPARKTGAADKRPDPTMKPGQKGANKLYTKAQFTQFYKGDAQKMWTKAGKLLAKKAPPTKKGGKKAGPPAAEKRRDPTMKPNQKGANKLYSRQEFTQFYGIEAGKKMWTKAGKLQAKSAPPAKKGGKAPAATKRPDPTMKPGQKGAGKLYTKAQFSQFYGKETGQKMWVKAGKLLAKKQQTPAKRGPPPRKAPSKKGAKASGKAQRRPDPTMKPGQKGANKTYTKEQFNAFYGADGGAKMWKKAGKLL